MDNITKKQQQLFKINASFYFLISDLKKEKFEFCSYLVEEAYRFFMIALEARLK